MERLTKKLTSDYVIPSDKLKEDEYGFVGEAAQRLAKFETVFENLVESQRITMEEMEKLKIADKTKTVKFRELMGKKVINNQLLLLFKAGGIEE